MLRETAERVGLTVLVVIFVALILGQVFGQPVLLAYVETGSMEPAIDAGDGFVAIPSAVTGPPQEGDIVTFRAEEIEGGGLTTHRIVGETEEGYITRGDANPFTDQDGDEPPVTEDQIVARALQIGDTPVTIPYLGVAIETGQSAIFAAVSAVLGALGIDADVSPGTVGMGTFGLGLVLFMLSFRPQGETGPERDTTRSVGEDTSIDGRRVAAILLIIVLVPANAAMVLPAGMTQLTIDGDEVAETEGVTAGDPVEAEFDARNDGLITLLLVFEPTDEDVSMEPEAAGIPAGQQSTATVIAPAPEPGVERTVVIREYRYLVVLPEGVIVGLHEIHPLVALGAINLLIAGGFVGFVGGLIGFREVRFRETSRDVPLRVRIKQRLR